MRIAVISDIHSNLQALTKALSLIDECGVDRVVCLGDVVGYGGNPNECVELVRERAAECVLGNHDLAALDTSHARFFTRYGRAAAQWTHDVLTEDNRNYLGNLPYRIDMDLLTLVHANPESPENWEYVFSLEDARPQFHHFETSFCCIGHSHVPFICGEDMKTFYVKSGLRFLINVGSIGQPRDRNPQLSFGVLDTEQFSYENIRTDYDVKGAAQAILDNDLPRFLADRLFNGV